MKLTKKQVDKTLENANLSYDDVDREFFMENGTFIAMVEGSVEIPDSIVTFIKNSAMSRLAETRRKEYFRAYNTTWSQYEERHITSAMCNSVEVDGGILSEISIREL